MKLIIDIDEQHFDLLQMAVRNGMGNNAEKIIAQGIPLNSGKWQYVPEDKGWYICSECRCGNDYADNFCPQCGARMESKEQTE